jgi:hypothetical protein
MSVIVRTGWGPYVARMIAALMRLLTLLALVLMPLGMSSAPAAASPLPAGHAMASASHCDDQPDQDQAPVAKMDCAAMCTALPATDGPEPASALKPQAPRIIIIAMPFEGTEPEIATPPPRPA